LQYSDKLWFLKPALAVSSGVAIAHGINLCAMLVLARLFTPNVIGMLVIFTSIAAIMVVIATLRLDQAVMIPDNSRDSSRLVALATTFAFLIPPGLLIFGFSFFSQTIYFSTSEKWQLFFMSWTSITVLGVANSLVTWHNRVGTYQTIAQYKISFAVATAVAQISLGFFIAPSALYLILGYTLGLVVSLPVLLVPFLRNHHQFKDTISSYKALLSQYQRFPKIELWASLANQINGLLPNILLSWLFSPTVTGYLSTGQKILTAPFTLLSEGVRLVVYKRLAGHDASREKGLQSALEMTLLLFFVSAPALFLVASYSNELVLAILGQQWKGSAIYVAILAPMILAQFSISPLVSFFMANDRMGHGLIWQITRTSLSISMLILGYFYKSPLLAVALYALGQTLGYLLLLLYLKMVKIET
jgi:O-antigen/teichoic acid export membrane protein